MTTYLKGNLTNNSELFYEVKLTDYNSFVILSESSSPTTFSVTVEREDRTNTHQVNVSPIVINDLIITGNIKSFKFSTKSENPILITIKPFKPRNKYANQGKSN